MKLSKAQRKLLSTLTSDYAPFRRRRGIPHMLGNPTVHALLNRGLVQIDTVPPRWRITPAGRAALEDER